MASTKYRECENCKCMEECTVDQIGFETVWICDDCRRDLYEGNL